VQTYIYINILYQYAATTEAILTDLAKKDSMFLESLLLCGWNTYEVFMPWKLRVVPVDTGTRLSLITISISTKLLCCV